MFYIIRKNFDINNIPLLLNKIQGDIFNLSVINNNKLIFRDILLDMTYSENSNNNEITVPDLSLDEKKNIIDHSVKTSIAATTNVDTNETESFKNQKEIFTKIYELKKKLID